MLIIGTMTWDFQAVMPTKIWMAMLGLRPRRQIVVVKRMVKKGKIHLRLTMGAQVLTHMTLNQKGEVGFSISYSFSAVALYKLAFHKYIPYKFISHLSLSFQ